VPIPDNDVLALADLVEYVGKPVAQCAQIKRLRARHDPDALPTLQREIDGVALAWAMAEVTIQPTTDLYRASSAATFHRYCTRPEWRPAAVDYAEFLAVIVNTAEDGRSPLLYEMLNQDQPVFPFPHSWLVVGDDIASLSGRGLIDRLKLRHQDPPFVLARLTVSRMVASGVEVRVPSVLDAVLGRKVQWKAGEVAGEMIDLDIHHRAIEDLRWVNS
jgi:hypothetical protein